MEPFYLAQVIEGSGASLEQLERAHPEIPREALKHAYERVLRERAESECWKNDRYQVLKRVIPETEHGFKGETLVHLSIKRIDRESVHDWRDLQEIKNTLVGDECEGFELYPAESRLVDGANQYHLWCFANPEARLPCGWWVRMVSASQGMPWEQRPFDEKGGQ